MKMKHLKTTRELNEASENLNISDVMSSFNDEKLVKFIKEIYMQGFYDAKWGMNEDEVESKSDKFNIKWVKKNCS